MLNIIFTKCFLVSVGQEKLLNFMDLKPIFILVLILNIFPNMHKIALQSIQVSNISRGSMPPNPLASSGLRPSISSLIEKLILAETSHENCWIHPCCHFNLPNRFLHNMTICGLSLQHENTESRKNLSQKFVSQLGRAKN